MTKSNTILKILKHFVKRSNLKNNTIVKNYFNTNYRKSALLVYITFPFSKKGDFQQLTAENVSHTNYKESRYIAKTLDNYGFIVDIVEYNDTNPYDTAGYDLIVGFGEAFEKSFNDLNKQVRIFYGSGQHPLSSDKKSLQSLGYLKERYNQWLIRESRLVRFAWQMQLHFSDVYVALGNNLVKNTYIDNIRGINNRASFYSLNCFYHENLVLSDQDFEEKVKHAVMFDFCWFGSSGAAHKGLFVLIEAFVIFQAKNTQSRLLVCGISEQTVDLIKQMFDDLTNVIFLGYINLSNPSETIKLKTVCMNVFPSVSEGGAASILNILASCGIPTVASDQVGLDENVLGMQMPNNNVATIFSFLECCSKLSKDNYVKIANRCFYDVKEYYTEKKYCENWSKILNEVIDENVKH